MKLTGITISKVIDSPKNTSYILGEEWGKLEIHCRLPPLQVPIIPAVISSYDDFYSQKEKRFAPGEDGGVLV